MDNFSIFCFSIFIVFPSIATLFSFWISGLLTKNGRPSLLSYSMKGILTPALPTFIFIGALLLWIASVYTGTCQCPTCEHPSDCEFNDYMGEAIMWIIVYTFIPILGVLVINFVIFAFRWFAATKASGQEFKADIS